MNKNPLISVVICAFSSKRFDKTMECIYSIYNNTYKNFEIVLVIDGNKELKQKMEYSFKGINNVLIVENEKNEGPSISRNLGVKYSKGDIVAFIDDDAFAENNWLEYIIRNFNYYPEILAVGGKLLPVYEEETKRVPDELLWIVGATYKGHPENKQFVRNVFTGNMAVKKSIFKDINFEIMFDKEKNKFLSHQLEDTLFCVRLNKKKNNAVLYDPDMIVHHHVPNERLSFGYIARRSFSEGILKSKLGQLNKDYNGQINGSQINGSQINGSQINGSQINGSQNTEVLSQEHSYLNIVLASLIKYFYKLNIIYGLLLLITVMSVFLGYVGCTLKERFKIK